MRQRWISLFADYDARVEMVYVESPTALILERNRRRPNAVPERVVMHLLEQLEPPTVTECHSLTLA